jgi:hypothetical protein
MYVQSAERNGHNRGNTSWRLSGFKKTIAAGRLP